MQIAKVLSHPILITFGQLALSRADDIANAPSWGAENEDRDPLKPPIGVRAAPTMTTSFPIDVEYLRTVGAKSALDTDILLQ